MASAREPGSPGVGGSSSTAIPSPETLRRRSVRLNDPDRRPSISRQSTPESTVSEARRRRSSLSRYSFSEATREFQEEIVDPGPVIERERRSWKSWLPFMFAVIPPAAGLIFKNGTAFFTDLILLFLAMVFLHWSVTAPWKWYYSAQQVREDQEAVLMEALEMKHSEPATKKSDSDSESSGSAPPTPAEKQERARKAQAALTRLRILEVAALIVCFLAPAAAAYLLNIIRDHLSRPHDGLVSNFNLTIFLLAAEIMPLKHCIKLVLAHTLHLQRIVNTNPYRTVHITPTKYRHMLQRLETLEERVLAQPPPPVEDDDNGRKAQQQQQMYAQMREDITLAVRAAITPDIEGVVRAVRRYEKKHSALAEDVEAQLADLRRRLDDAIALSAVVAARTRSDSGWGMLDKVGSAGVSVVLFPFTGTAWAFGVALEAVKGLFGVGRGGRKRRRRRVVEITEDQAGGRVYDGGRVQVVQGLGRAQQQQVPAKHGRVVVVGEVAPSSRAGSRSGLRVS